MIGSNDISLEASLVNHAEPAYLTTIAFILPQGIVLRSILPSCEEDTVGDNLTITCTAGNPLEKDELVRAIGSSIDRDGRASLPPLNLSLNSRSFAENRETGLGHEAPDRRLAARTSTGVHHGDTDSQRESWHAYNEILAHVAERSVLVAEWVGICPV